MTRQFSELAKEAWLKVESRSEGFRRESQFALERRAGRGGREGTDSSSRMVLQSLEEVLLLLGPSAVAGLFWRGEGRLIIVVVVAGRSFGLLGRAAELVVMVE